MVLLSFEPRYHQISAIFQAFLLNFPCSIFLYFFPWRQSSIYQMTVQCPLWEFHFFFHSFIIYKTIYIQKKFSFQNTRVGSSVARFWHATRETGVQFPVGAFKAFSFVSYLNSRHQWKNPKFHRYLYIKYICDVIIQYLGD